MNTPSVISSDVCNGYIGIYRNTCVTLKINTVAYNNKKETNCET